jgi:hypothetical protein
MDKLNPELKKKWIDALRSGKYNQGRTYLAKNNNYCCLGVLADLSGNLTDEKENGIRFCKTNEESPKGKGWSCVSLWAESDILINKEQKSKLIRMNDEENRTFPEIADYIEKCEDI